MIELRIKKYCENCGRFEPEVMKEEHTTFHDNDPYYKTFDTVITCQHAQCCETIVTYLKEYPVEVENE